MCAKVLVDILMILFFERKNYMNKKIKIISLASAAALLTIAPVTVSTMPVLADTESTTPTPVNGDSYFTCNGKKLSNRAIAPVGNGIAIHNGETLGDILKSIQTAVPFHSKLNQDQVTQSNLETLEIALSHLKGVTVSGSGPTAVVTFDANTVINTRISISGQAEYSYPSVYVTLTNQSTDNASPVINFSYYQNGQEVTDSLPQQVFQVAKGSNFNSLNFKDSNGQEVKFSAIKSLTNDQSLSIKVDENTVDTAKAGSVGEVKLTASNSNGDKTSVTYKVLVQPNNGLHRLGFQGYVAAYRIKGQEVTKVDQIYAGEGFYIGKDTQIVNGNTYTRVSTKAQTDADNSSNNTWMLTNDVMTPSVEVFEGTIMHKALVYDAGGGSKVRKLADFKKMLFQKEPYIIHGTKYYKIAGAPDYIKATNITGTKRTLKHNAYIYATSTRRADRQILKKGTKVTTYGGSYKFKNGKRYYRIEGATKPHKRYVRVSNFE